MDISVSVEGHVPQPNFPAAIARANLSTGKAGVRAGRATLGTHRRTGATSAGLRVRTRPSEAAVEWYDGMPQALFLEEGTRPHEINPRNKQALWWPGLSHPISKVGPPVTKLHPGTPAYHWLETGITRSIPLFERFYTDRVMGEFDD